MNNDVKQGMAWQSAYYDKFAEILRHNAQSLITVRVATPDEDMKQATDFVLEIGGGGKVATRVRRDGKFFGDITLRSYSRGWRTELAKLRDADEGVARYYLYCWTDDSGQIDRWLLWDIDKMRQAGLLNKDWPERANYDGQTKFVMIPIAELQASGCVIDTQLPSPRPIRVNGQTVFVLF